MPLTNKNSHEYNPEPQRDLAKALILLRFKQNKSRWLRLQQNVLSASGASRGILAGKQ